MHESHEYDRKEKTHCLLFNYLSLLICNRNGSQGSGGGSAAADELGHNQALVLGVMITKLPAPLTDRANKKTRTAFALLVELLVLNTKVTLAHASLIVTKVASMKSRARDWAAICVQHHMSREVLGVSDTRAITASVRGDALPLVLGVLLPVLALILLRTILHIDHGARSTSSSTIATAALVDLLMTPVGLVDVRESMLVYVLVDGSESLACECRSCEQSDHRFALSTLSTFGNTFIDAGHGKGEEKEREV